MKKQYMDFVPTAKQKTQSESVKTQVQPVASRRKVVDGMVRRAPNLTLAQRNANRTSNLAPIQRSMDEPINLAQTQRSVNTTRTTATFSIRDGAELGMIQDTNTRFVQTEVEKRPLSSGQYFGEKRIDAKTIKAEKIGNKAKKAVLVERFSGEEQKPKETYVPPMGKFINQGKIEKRPLSKTTYRKAVPVAPIEEPKGPVTIITKPEKQSHAGLIVTIILTIILGAAAGTVAFLLLPK